MSLEEQIRMENIADTDHEIFALLKQRYSPRTFKNEKIRLTHLDKLFEAARWSASSGNAQPWRFIYTHRSTEAYNKILKCLSTGNKRWATNAPILMLSIYKEKLEDGRENFHALHDLGLSLGNMTIQAQYLGIALHHMAGIDWQRAQREFLIPKGYHITSAIAMGYYGGKLDNLPSDLKQKETAHRDREPQKSFAFKSHWEA